MKKSLLFGCAALAALALGLFVACGGNGDPTSPSTNPPVPITAKSVNLAVTTGDTAFKVAATGGALAFGLKVYIKDEGDAITITKAAAPSGYTEFGGSVSQSGGVIVVTGLTAADSSGGPTTLDSDAPVPVTLAADAQTSQVSAIIGVSKVPYGLGDSTYTVVDSLSTTSEEVFLDAGYEIKVGNGGSTDDETLDPDIDREVVTLLQSLQATDTFTISSSALTAVVFNAAPSPAAFNTILGFGIPAISLAEDFTLTGSTAIPTATALTIAATKTLTIDTGVILTLDGAGSIVLTNAASNPAKIVFAGTGATLITGGNGVTELAAAAGVFADSGTAQDIMLVSAFTELTITGDNNVLTSIVYTSGSNPYITGPANNSGSGGTLSATTDCQ